MSDIFVTELGDMLATNNLCDELCLNTLPSPNQLKRKILLKGKIKTKKKVIRCFTSDVDKNVVPLRYQI